MGFKDKLINDDDDTSKGTNLPISIHLVPLNRYVQTNDVVKLPNGNLKIMSETDMLDYLESESMATKPYLIILLEGDIIVAACPPQPGIPLMRKESILEYINLLMSITNK